MPPVLAGLIRVLGFFAPTLGVVAAAHFAAVGSSGEFVDALASSLLIFTLPFWLGDFFGRRRPGRGAPVWRELASGLGCAAAVQAIVWLFWLSLPHDVRYSFPLWVTAAHPLICLLAGAFWIPIVSHEIGEPFVQEDGSARRFLVRAALVATTLSAVGLLLHWINGDRWLLTAPFYFALPPVVAAGLALVGATAALVARRRTAALVASTLALIGGLLALRGDYRAGDCAPFEPGGGLRVVTWNVGHRLTPVMAQRLRELEADLAIVVEGDGAGRWSEHFGGYSVCEPGQGLVLLSRVGLTSCSLHSLGTWSWAATSTLETEPPLHVIAVDIDGNPLRSRTQPIAALAELAHRRDSARTLLAGDFNTPRRAASFAALGLSRHDAFDAAGSGWAPTWPASLPVLDLDHIWLPRAWKPLCARPVASSGSDHLPVVVDLPNLWAPTDPEG